MNNKTVNILNRFFRRVMYYRIIVIGIALISFSLTTIITGYELINKPDFNLFIEIICMVLGLAITFIGLYYRVETEMNLEQEKDDRI